MKTGESLLSIGKFIAEYSAHLMGAGVHTSRVVRNTKRIGEAFGLDVKLSVFHRNIILTIIDKETNEACNEVIDIPAHPISFEHNSELSASSWEAVDNHLSLEELKDKYIRFDWAIKRLLRQKANFGVLEGFLTVFLGEKVTIEEILESESNQEAVNDKFNRVDIKARNSKGEIIIIEVQNTREIHYLERILYGVAKAITEHISLGERYVEVKKVYSISILYFDLGEGEDFLYHGQNRFIGVHCHDELKVSEKQRNAIAPKMPSAVFPEYILIRVNDFNKVAKTPLEEWVNYLKNGVIDENTTAPGLSEARKKLQYYSMSESDREAYKAHLIDQMVQNDEIDSAKEEGRIEGRAEGIAEGWAKGKEEGIMKTAVGMKAAGIPVTTIASITGLSEEVIANL